MKKWLIGIDEAGRGPLAGPVAVGVVLVPSDFDWRLISGVGDSKKLTSKNREAIFRRAKELKHSGHLDFAVAMVGAKMIDRIGIVPAVSRAMARALKAVGANDLCDACQVKLDGGLRAPVDFRRQETIIRGDVSEPSIGLASIMAKVTRDRYMERMGRRPEYVVYNLPVHKGYGTKAHRLAIKKHGCTDLHRVTYCKNVIMME